jgi:hypothetical protein
MLQATTNWLRKEEVLKHGCIQSVYPCTVLSTLLTIQTRLEQADFGISQ